MKISNITPYGDINSEQNFHTRTPKLSKSMHSIKCFDWLVFFSKYEYKLVLKSYMRARSGLESGFTIHIQN